MRRAPWTGAIFPPGSRGGPLERLVRLALAVVLLAAAGLKMASLVGGGLLSGQAAVTGVLSLVEGLVALWLAWGGVGAVWAALILFGAFAGYSLRGALAGRATCGCFGPVAVPLWGALAMDGAAMGLLAASGGGRRWPARLGLGCLAAGSVWLLPPSLLPLENDAGWLRPAPGAIARSVRHSRAAIPAAGADRHWTGIGHGPVARVAVSPRLPAVSPASGRAEGSRFAGGGAAAGFGCPAVGSRYAAGGPMCRLPAGTAGPARGLGTGDALGRDAARRHRGVRAFA